MNLIGCSCSTHSALCRIVAVIDAVEHVEHCSRSLSANQRFETFRPRRDPRDADSLSARSEAGRHAAEYLMAGRVERIGGIVDQLLRAFEADENGKREDAADLTGLQCVCVCGRTWRRAY